MSLTPLALLLGETDESLALGRLHAGARAAIELSTWGQFAKSGLGFTASDVDGMSAAIVAFIRGTVDHLPDLSVVLSGECYLIGSQFDPLDFAERLSEDLVSESLYAARASKTSQNATEMEDRATAALLYRYKYCAIANDFFDMATIIAWARSVDRTEGQDAKIDKIPLLLRALTETVDAGISAAGRIRARELLGG